MRPTQPSIPPGLVNENQLWLGRQRKVWLIPFMDKCVGMQTKLWNPLTTRAIPERFCDEVPLCRGTISSVLYLYKTTPVLFKPVVGYQTTPNRSSLPNLATDDWGGSQNSKHWSFSFWRLAHRPSCWHHVVETAVLLNERDTWRRRWFSDTVAFKIILLWQMLVSVIFS